MSALQQTLIVFLSLAAACGVLFFNKQGRTHKPAAAVLAWVVFCQMACLSAAAALGDEVLTQWLLIGCLAVHAINILLAKGNINKVRPHVDFVPQKVGAKRPRPRNRCARFNKQGSVTNE